VSILKNKALLQKIFATVISPILIVSLLFVSIAANIVPAAIHTYRGVTIHEVILIIRTEKQTLPPDQCNKIHNAIEQMVSEYSSDLNGCIATVVHTSQGSFPFIQFSGSLLGLPNGAPPSLCLNSGRSTVTAHASLSYRKKTFF
jgi:hypothetical protein